MPKLPITWTRKRMVLALGVTAVCISVPISWRTFREKAAEAQNPMGDGATAAVADTNGAPVAAPAPAPAEVAAVQAGLGSRAADATKCMTDLQQRLAPAATP